MRIIIAGSREFQDYDLLKRKLDSLTKNLKSITVISGGAKGADKLGEQWAYENMLTVIKYHPDWSKHGKAAGAIRNVEMADNADCLICFWNGSSPGSKDMIDKATKKGLKVRVIRYDQEK